MLNYLENPRECQINNENKFIGRACLRSVEFKGNLRHERMLFFTNLAQFSIGNYFLAVLLFAEGSP